jgi:hypothetical protein
MKQLQYITTFSLILAFTGLSPVVAADAGRTSGGERIQPDLRQIENPLGYKLSPEQMDKVHGGNRSLWPETGGRQPNGVTTYVPGGSGQYNGATWVLIPDSEQGVGEGRPWTRP